MQFAFVTILSLATLAFAIPARLDNIAARQAASSSIPAEASVGTDAEGNIHLFNATDVYKAATANGL